MQRGDMATGWSIGWKINLWARLLDGNHADKIIRNFVTLLPASQGNGYEGEVKGLRARGNFVVDMKWSGGQLSKALIKSNIGGKIRLRSYVPLKGKGLCEANGECPNPFMNPSVIPDAIVSDEVEGQYPVISRTYEYDLDTKAGQTYEVEKKF